MIGIFLISIKYSRHWREKCLPKKLEAGGIAFDQYEINHVAMDGFLNADDFNNKDLRVWNPRRLFQILSSTFSNLCFSSYSLLKKHPSHHDVVRIEGSWIIPTIFVYDFRFYFYLYILIVYIFGGVSAASSRGVILKKQVINYVNP